MKKYTIFCTIACIVICILCCILFGDNSTNSITVQPVRMLITGMQGVDPCILEVYPNGILEATVGRLSLETTDGSLDSREYFANDAQRKWRKLSKKDCRIINESITRIKSECTEDNEHTIGFLDVPIVYAIIDEKHYESLFYDMDKALIKNEDLSNLAQKLVELSPINFI